MRGDVRGCAVAGNTGRVILGKRCKGAVGQSGLLWLERIRGNVYEQKGERGWTGVKEYVLWEAGICELILCARKTRVLREVKEWK